MSQSPLAFPSDQIADEIYSRLKTRDPVATSLLFDAYLEPLLGWLSRNNPEISHDLREDAVQKTLTDIVKKPKRFDPTKSKITSYLCMSAAADLKNILRQEKRHRHQPLESVEFSENLGKYIVRADDPSLPMQIAEAKQQQLEALPAGFLDALDESARVVCDLMMDGERKTAVFVDALGIGHLSPDEQKKHVKRIKDKIKKRLQRKGLSDEGSS